MNETLEELETQGKLQVKIGRTLLRAKLIMIGNVLLVAWLMAVVLLYVWYAVYLWVGPAWVATAVISPLGLTVEQFQRLNIVAMTAWKLAAALLLLCPGLGFRLCGRAMKP